jgi:hypothetical protein
MAKSQIEKANLVSLRDYLIYHYCQVSGYAGTFFYPGQKNSRFNKDLFEITWELYSKDDPTIKIARKNAQFLIHDSYDVLTFTYHNYSISAQVGKLEDEFDKKMVKDVYTTLSEKSYDKMVSNLDELVLKG